MLFCVRRQLQPAGYSLTSPAIVLGANNNPAPDPLCPLPVAAAQDIHMYQAPCHCSQLTTVPSTLPLFTTHAGWAQKATYDLSLQRLDCETFIPLHSVTGKHFLRKLDNEHTFPNK